MPRDSDEAFWNEAKVLMIREEPSDKPVYDLEERTARFGEAVIDFARTIPQDTVTNRIIYQLVGAATSVGANYVEADDAVSKHECTMARSRHPRIQTFRHSSFIILSSFVISASSF